MNAEIASILTDLALSVFVALALALYHLPRALMGLVCLVESMLNGFLHVARTHAQAKAYSQSAYRAKRDELDARHTGTSL